MVMVTGYNEQMNPVTLDTETQQRLQEIAQSAPNTFKTRAKLILAYAEGMQTIQAALTAGLSRGRARYWKREFNRRGMDIFEAYFDPTDESYDAQQVLRESTVDDGNEIPNVDTDESNDQEKVKRKQKGKDKKEKKFVIPVLPLPEPVKSPGVVPDDTLAEAGRKIMLAQFAEMLHHEAGTRLGEDIEALHDMRVATRRLRAAFDIFGHAFQKKAVKSHLAGLRQIGRLLGAVRDLDVFMEKAEGYLESLPEDTQQGLDPLLLSWRSQRADTRARLLSHFDSPTYGEYISYFNYFAQTSGSGVQILKTGTLIPNRVCEVVPCLIYTRLAMVRAYSPIVNTATIPQLHALRIEFKRLRYALEFFVEVLGGEAKQVIDLIKKMQDHLGDLHDADVACQILNSFLDNWDRGQIGLQLSARQNPEPIVNYLAYRHAERHRLLVTFPEAWDQFDQSETYQKVASAISIL